jgi:hypothetical protein
MQLHSVVWRKPDNEYKFLGYESKKHKDVLTNEQMGKHSNVAAYTFSMSFWLIVWLSEPWSQMHLAVL